MAKYPELASRVRTAPPDASRTLFEQDVLSYLADVWFDDYTLTTPKNDIVMVTVARFSYMFDISTGRLIAAWGFSSGKVSTPRPEGRMKGHPKGAGALYHRGHAIPHTLGGLTDINLVPQLGRINTGAFRKLEIEAVAKPGSFYFTYWSYAKSLPAKDGGAGQTPSSVDQGLLLPGSAPTVVTHEN